jgi:hypothetical protein
MWSEEIMRKEKVPSSALSRKKSLSKNFTVGQMKSALLSVQDKMTDRQLLMLRAHYTHRTLSMEKIAAAGGYKNFESANLHYGILWGQIAKQLGFVTPSKTSTIASGAGNDAEGHFQWRMDDVAVKALRSLGWFRDAAKKKPDPSRLPTPSRVLFARVGWMTYYAGPQIGDEKPIGGGENNKKNIGHEIFNFTSFGGRLYGFVSTPKGHIGFERIEPTSSKQDRLDDVLVVFVARQCIIGWYLGATVHRTGVKFPFPVASEIRKRLTKAGTKHFKLENYRFETSAKNAMLLPTHERTHEVPGGVKGGFGQSNLCYQYQNSGKRKSFAWMSEAVSYVLNYNKENLLTNFNAENESDEAAAISQEQAAGFQSNAAIRTAVENFAMSRAHSVLVAKGYKNLKNTAKLKPYDYTCERNGKGFFVEVKGTQTPGKTLILTRGEVKHISSHTEQSVLVLVHSVRVSGKRTIRVSGGTAEVRESWRLRREDLSPIQYAWTVS